MTSSDSIAALAAALSKAQSTMTSAKKDSTNPHFKSRYADLASIWDACREPLTKNGLAVVQLPGKDEAGYYVETVLTHASGEFIGEKLHIVPTKDDPQGLGSAITYARRYGLAAVAGIAPDDSDDDGEAAMGRNEVRREQAARVAQSTQAKPQPISRPSQDDF
jgi:ERF superfamily